MTSRDDAHHRVAGQFPVSLALDCRSPVAGASARSPEDDRVRRAGQNARQCTADLRPNPAAARLILIAQHIDKLIGAVGSGPLDARALDLQRVVLLAGPPADAGDTDGPDHALAKRASLRCASLPFMTQDHQAHGRSNTGIATTDGGDGPRMPGTVRGDRLRQDTCHLGTCSRPWPWHAITGHRRRARWRCRQSCSRMGGGLTVKAEPHCWRRRPGGAYRVHANAIAGGRARGL